MRKHFPHQEIAFFDATPTAPPYCVLLECADHTSEDHARAQLEALLAAALDQGCATNAVVAHNLAQAQQLWQIRESIPLAQAREGLNIKHDISLPVSQIPAFVAETDAAIARGWPGTRLVNYGHLGDGNLHYNVQAPADADAEVFLRTQEAPVNACVYAMVDQYHGSISAEHGIGSLKRDTLLKHKPAQALAWMRAIKHALDPHGLMNPNRVLAHQERAAPEPVKPTESATDIATRLI